jgi:hypothetical protein
MIGEIALATEAGADGVDIGKATHPYSKLSFKARTLNGSGFLPPFGSQRTSSAFGATR